MFYPYLFVMDQHKNYYINQQNNRKKVYIQMGMFTIKFYPSEKKFSMDNTRASMTNSMPVQNP